ncbi:MAG: restriction endonuclease [Candidatus Nezhaarchaeales archaeon]
MSAAKAEALLKMLELKNLPVDSITALEISEEVLYELKAQGIINIESGMIKVVNPIGLAIEAIRLGIDIEAASRWLSWRDFEKFCVEALTNHNFKVKAPLRFKCDKKRYEVDVVAAKHKIVLCLDCKHWKMRGYQSYKIKEAAIKHLDKCLKLAELTSTLRDAGLHVQSGDLLIPLIVTLMDLGFRSPVNEVLVIPIFKFNSFLLDFEAHIDEVPLIEIH